jgi:hypothetical protein
MTINGSITARVACETACVEGIVPEWYLDSATPPVGTWGIGVTNASGHFVRSLQGQTRHD